VLKHGPLCYATPGILIHTVILPLIFFAQIAAAADPIYSTQAVRDLVNGAVIANPAVGQLGAGSVIPISRATGGFRATLGLGVTLFSGAAHLGFARPVDHQAGWRFVGGLGRSF